MFCVLTLCCLLAFGFALRVSVVMLCFVLWWSVACGWLIAAFLEFSIVSVLVVVCMDCVCLICRVGFGGLRLLFCLFGCGCTYESFGLFPDDSIRCGFMCTCYLGVLLAYFVCLLDFGCEVDSFEVLF